VFSASSAVRFFSGLKVAFSLCNLATSIGTISPHPSS
jgi:hypothetical protein